jgi:AAA ATPase domain
MRIQFVEIQNFRKLKSIRIDFASETTLFVGANNSGKTSAIEALGHFLLDQSNFRMNDFTLSNWRRINEIGRDWEGLADQPGSVSPSLADWETVLPSLDLWLDVGGDEIRYVNHLLPTLEWEGGLLGVRLRLEPKKVEELFKEYVSAVRGAKKTRQAAQHEDGSAESTVALWPRTMQDFLERRLRTLFALSAYSLDPTKQTLPANGVASPQQLPAGSVPIEGDPLKGLIRIDMIYAQRDFADVNRRDRLDGGEPSRNTETIDAATFLLR